MLKITLALLLVAASGVLSAQPARHDFLQSGFSEAATLSGFFVGEDVDGDGRISSLEGEVSDFALRFSGNSLVPAFSLGIAELEGLVYVADGGPLGDDDDPVRGEGIRARSGDLLYILGPGPDEFAGIVCGQGVDCSLVSDGSGTDFSAELLSVSRLQPAQAVPFAPWSWLILAGLLGLAGWQVLGSRR